MQRDFWDHIRSRYVVIGDEDELRFEGQPHCPLLKASHISHLGLLSTDPPYELTRSHLTGSFFIASIRGEGEVYDDGEWRALPSNQATLLPPFCYNSIRSEDKFWKFLWIKFSELESSVPYAMSGRPVFGSLDASSMQHAILGFYHSCINANSPAIQNLWLKFIERYMHHFYEPRVVDKRMWKLWRLVEENPSRPWTAKTMSALVHMSTEHLRRLCQKQFNRSPRQQLISLRMQKASLLLATTDQKISTIAHAVGYSDAYSFSKAFKVHNGGCSPSDFRS